MAQPGFLPLHHEIHNRYEQKSYKDSILLHTAFKPLLKTDFENLGISQNDIYNIRPYHLRRSNFFTKAFDNFVNGHLILTDTNDFYLTINPLFNLQAGYEVENKRNLWVNTRGFLVEGAIGKNFAFSSSFLENQSVFPHYLDTFIQVSRVVPGQGLMRKFKTGGYDYSMASGYISYSPSKIFNFQLGNDKVVVGDGYRSMLLSDNSFNYPFLKITTTIHKFRYTNLYAQFQNTRGGNPLGIGFQKKFGAFHFLSYNVNKRLNIGFFESIIWQAGDSIHRGFELSYLNPVIFLRPIEFGLGSPDNALMGLTFKYKACSKAIFYGQLAMDDFNFRELKKKGGFYQQKIALQAGINLPEFISPFHHLRLEYNQASPYIYSHKLPAQNYSHYNQALAHPQGANFREVVLISNCYYKRFSSQVKAIYARYGADTSGAHFGKDIFKSDFDIPGYPKSYGNYTGQGIKTDFVFLDARLGYLINPVTNLRVYVNYTHRLSSSAISTSSSNIINVGIITDLRNFYYDF